MARNPCIQCRVTYETKVRLHAIAEERGVTESALLKKFVDVVLLQSAGIPDSNFGPKGDASPRNARLLVRLRPDVRIPEHRDR
jgi:hypothetical protein